MRPNGKWFHLLMPAIVLFIISCVSHDNAINPEGRSSFIAWAGPFMSDDYTLLITLADTSSLDTGTIQMFLNGEMLQNDPLSNIEYSDSILTFHIPAKQTTFTGTTCALDTVLRGSFQFPDGSLHSFIGRKAELAILDVSRGAQGKPILTADDIQNEITFLDSVLRALHPALFLYQSLADYKKSLIALNSPPNQSMELMTFYGALLPVVANIGCTHTVLHPPEPFINDLKKAGVIPGSYLLDEDGLKFRTDPVSETQPGMHGRVVSINGIPEDKIVERMMNTASSDGRNEYYKRWFISQNFPFLYGSLFGLDSAFEITFSQVSETGLPAIRQVILPATTPNLHKTPKPPLELSVEGNGQVAVLTIRAFVAEDFERFRTELAKYFDSLHEMQVKGLILDLRDNSGGHPFLSVELLKHCIPDSFPYFTADTKNPELADLYKSQHSHAHTYQGDLIVLTNSGVSSTAGHFLSVLRANRQITIIGEPSGSGFACNDFHQTITLPISGLKLNIPRTRFTTAVPPNLQTVIIKPDIPVRIVFYRAKDDFVMTKALQLLAHNTG